MSPAYRRMGGREGHDGEAWPARSRRTARPVLPARQPTAIGDFPPHPKKLKKAKVESVGECPVCFEVPKVSEPLMKPVENDDFLSKGDPKWTTGMQEHLIKPAENYHFLSKGDPKWTPGMPKPL